MSKTSFFVLQGLAWPDHLISSERDLFFKLSDGAAFSQERHEIVCPRQALARFDTYANLFNIGKWRRHCDLRDLSLSLTGDGEFELVIFLVSPERSWGRVYNDIVTLQPGEDFVADIQNIPNFPDTGLLFFELRSLSTRGVIQDASWQTRQPPVRTPELMLSITTFRREAAVQEAVARFEAFLKTTPHSRHIHLTVVDNGNSAKITNTQHVTVLPNENLGGSGGFARGLLEAKHREASHCLFMDDDAAVQMIAIERTWIFLAYATDSKTAVAGAVANSQHKWKVWENGALFDHVCQPQQMDVDLRDASQLFAMEFASTQEKPRNFYAGWWYFAFPVAHVKNMPFPFFVRGDDVSFSLANEFRIVTLPGVMSFQDEDFSTKESPLTVYLDLRSHLAHHLSLPEMEIGRKGILKIMARFWMRSFLACHYETLEAVHLAHRDVLAGPEFFRENADLSTRRKEIGDLTRIERPKTFQDTNALKARSRAWIPASRLLPRFMMKVTLNGHLLPGFRYVSNRIVLPDQKRGQIRPIWGASEISYISADGARSYTVHHHKGKAWQTTRAILGDMLQMWRGYEATQEKWRKGYDSLTAQSFWENRLNVSPGGEADTREG